MPEGREAREEVADTVERRLKGRVGQGREGKGREGKEREGKNEA